MHTKGAQMGTRPIIPRPVNLVNLVNPKRGVFFFLIGLLYTSSLMNILSYFSRNPEARARRLSDDALPWEIDRARAKLALELEILENYREFLDYMGRTSRPDMIVEYHETKAQKQRVWIGTLEEEARRRRIPGIQGTGRSPHDLARQRY